jgi:Protein of unknown function (DUF3305)
MPTMSMEIGVVIARRKPKSRWIDVIWEAAAVLPEPAAAAPGTSLGTDGEDERFYAGAYRLEAHTYETPQYQSNLMSARPQLWVVIRPRPEPALPEIVQVTCDPTEGEGFTETGWDIVNVVPMPGAVQAALQEFIAAHHVERVFFKRKRDRADPEALAHGRKGPEADRLKRERGG